MRPVRSFSSFILCIAAIALLSACTERTSTPPSLPTQVDPAARATSIVLTRESPPAGFDLLALPQIDVGLERLNGWRYEMSFSFEGVYSGTTRLVRAETRAEVSYNLVTSARRVLATLENDLQDDQAPVTYEAVLLGEDAFLVRDGTCLSNNPQDARSAASLGAGSLLGGIRQADSLPRRATINTQEVFGYRFEPDSLLLPNVGFGEDSQLLAITGELWYSPTHQAVVRYYLNLELERVRILESSLPMTGTLLLRYDVYDVGVAPNISVPFGC